MPDSHSYPSASAAAGFRRGDAGVSTLGRYGLAPCLYAPTVTVPHEWSVTIPLVFPGRPFRYTLWRKSDIRSENAA